MALHDKSQKSCRLLYDMTKHGTHRHVPNLYFNERDTATIPRDNEITNVYNGRDRLNITAAKVGRKLKEA